MNVITAWSNTYRLIAAEVDFEQSKLTLRVAPPIQLNNFSKDTEEIKIMLGWMLPNVKGDLKDLSQTTQKELVEGVQALQIDPVAETTSAQADTKATTSQSQNRSS